MCLYIGEHPKQKTAKEDIKCYKVLAAYPTYKKGKIDEKEETRYFTPYQNMKYHLGETIREEGRVKRGYEDGFRSLPTISGGCLHVFANLDQAIDFANHRYPIYTIHQEWVVVECIIPQGTKYYEGMTGPQNPKSSYASKVLHVTDNIVYKTY